MASHWPCVTDNTGNYHLRAHRTQTGRWAPRLFLRRRGTFIFTSTFYAGWHKIADTCFSHCVCFTAWFYTGSFDFFHLRSSCLCVSADFNWAISIGYSIAHNFVKCWSVFKILSPSDSATNAQWKFYKRSHQTSNGSLHYLVKSRCQETTDDMKQMFCLTINFKLSY